MSNSMKKILLMNKCNFGSSNMSSFSGRWEFVLLYYAIKDSVDIYNGGTTPNTEIWQHSQSRDKASCCLAGTFCLLYLSSTDQRPKWICKGNQLLLLLPIESNLENLDCSSSLSPRNTKS